MTDADVYTLFCVFKGHWAPFIVEINKNKMIAHLNEAIKLKHPAVQVDAEDLELFRIDSDVPTSTKEEPLQLKLSPLSDPGDEIVEIFPSSPKKRKIHILVQLPGRPGKHCSAMSAFARFTFTFSSWPETRIC